VPRHLPAAVLSALLLAGCGGSDESGFEEQGTSAGLTTYQVASEGFAVAVPEAWRAISVDELGDGGELESAIEETPSLAPYAEALRGPNSVLKFVAVDPKVRNAFATNLNVIVEELPSDATLEQYEQATLAQLRAFPSVRGEIESERDELPAGPSVRLSYSLELTSGGRLVTVATRQYLLVAPRAAYILTYTTLPELASDYEDAFAESARSFRLS